MHLFLHSRLLTFICKAQRVKQCLCFVYRGRTLLIKAKTRQDKVKAMRSKCMIIEQFLWVGNVPFILRVPSTNQITFLVFQGFGYKPKHGQQICINFIFLNPLKIILYKHGEMYFSLHSVSNRIHMASGYYCISSPLLSLLPGTGFISCTVQLHEVLGIFLPECVTIIKNGIYSLESNRF